MHQTLYTGTWSFTEGPKNLSSRSVDSSHNFRRFLFFVFLIFPKKIGAKITQSCLPMNPGKFCSWNPQLRNFLFVESGILGSRIRNTAQRIRNPTITGIQNPSSIDKELRFTSWYLESAIHGVEFRIQGRLRFPSMRRVVFYLI